MKKDKSDKTTNIKKGQLQKQKQVQNVVVNVGKIEKATRKRAPPKPRQPKPKQPPPPPASPFMAPLYQTPIASVREAERESYLIKELLKKLGQSEPKNQLEKPKKSEEEKAYTKIEEQLNKQSLPQAFSQPPEQPKQTSLISELKQPETPSFFSSIPPPPIKTTKQNLTELSTRRKPKEEKQEIYASQFKFETTQPEPTLASIISFPDVEYKAQPKQPWSELEVGLSIPKALHSSYQAIQERFMPLPEANIEPQEAPPEAPPEQTQEQSQEQQLTIFQEEPPETLIEEPLKTTTGQEIMQLKQLTAGETQPYASQFLFRTPPPIQGLPTNLTERGYIVPDSEALRQLRMKAFEPPKPQLQIAETPAEIPADVPISPEIVGAEDINEENARRMDKFIKMKVFDIRALATNLDIPIRYTKNSKSNYFTKQDLVGKIIQEKNNNPELFNLWMDTLA